MVLENKGKKSSFLPVFYHQLFPARSVTCLNSGLIVPE
jgi:hypothetical protein